MTDNDMTVNKATVKETSQDKAEPLTADDLEEYLGRPAVYVEDVAAAVRYERERLMAWWENQHRASIEGEAEEIELLLEKHDVPEELEDCLRTVANQLKYEVTNGEFEEVIREVQADSFADVFPDDKEGGS